MNRALNESKEGKEVGGVLQNEAIKKGVGWVRRSVLEQRLSEMSRQASASPSRYLAGSACLQGCTTIAPLRRRRHRSSSSSSSQPSNQQPVAGVPSATAIAIAPWKGREGDMWRGEDLPEGAAGAPLAGLTHGPGGHRQSTSARSPGGAPRYCCGGGTATR